jgi:mono/diheme cytochrome c family protein
MGVREPWTEDTQAYVDLTEFLEEKDEGDGEAPELSFEIVEPPESEVLDDGDAEVGEELFHETCFVCHGDYGVGTSRAPQLRGEVLTAERIASRARLAGPRDSAVYEGLQGGRMPFWSADRLSDEELADIAAFVVENDPDAADSGDPLDSEGRDCAANHDKVGQSFDFISRFHDVGGTATIVDDCTIVIEDFSFDGGGIDVRFTTGSDGDYSRGLNLGGGNLVRSEPYDGETVTLTVPEGHTLDEIDGLSVWCIAVGVSFGDGEFAP